jgi:hypothetical protein
LNDDVKASSIISTKIVDINSEGLVGNVFNWIISEVLWH